MTPLALADLGAGLDANPDTLIAAGKHVVSSAPDKLAAHVNMTGAAATASLRLYIYEPAFGRWVPSVIAAQTLDTSVAETYEMRWDCGGINAHRALVKTGGTGTSTISYVFRQGR